MHLQCGITEKECIVRTVLQNIRCKVYDEYDSFHLRYEQNKWSIWDLYIPEYYFNPSFIY